MSMVEPNVMVNAIMGKLYDVLTNGDDRETMRVPGLQVIGFKCHILPKSPDPLSSISKWI